jgi:Protein of unknown function (DUF3386)
MITPGATVPRSRRARSWMSLGLAIALAAAPAAAHFMWLEVGSGSRPVLRLSFGEAPQEPTDADLLPRLAPAQVRDAAGGALVLASGDGAWTGTLGGSGGATAALDWGVVDRDGETFSLQYYAKATPSLAEAGADMGLPLEVIARQDGTQVVARVRRGGTGVANSPVHVHYPSGRSLELTADERGEVRFDLDGAGVYGVRARWMEEREGSANGKAFGEVRHYATLSFASSASALAAAPAGAPAAAVASAHAEADPVAYALLKGAHDSRQVMPADDPGFRCDLVFEKGDATYMGHLVYRRQGQTEVEFDGLDEKSLKWVRDQVLNQVGHRRGGDFAKGDGKYPLQLGPKDDNPYGQLILVNDDMGSSYRVRDDRVLEVTRVADGLRFTISVIETMDADDGKYLANHFVVSYRDEHTGVLKKFEGYRDKYAHIDSLWLPVWRTVLEVGDAPSPLVRTIRYRNVVRLQPSEGEIQAEGG